jgi:uncharacterized protein (DUF433 family)
MSEKEITYDIAENGCWNCTSHASNTFGYPMITRNGIHQTVYHLMYELHHGRVPQGLVIRHKCDNPKCINPDHLEIGTYKDNCHDMISRGRDTIVGSRNTRARLNEEKVKEILGRISHGERQADLAREYKVPREVIYSIVHGKAWRHVSNDIIDPIQPYFNPYKRKLSPADVKTILIALKAHEKQKNIAKKFGVSESRICDIKSSKAADQLRGLEFSKTWNMDDQDW